MHFKLETGSFMSVAHGPAHFVVFYLLKTHLIQLIKLINELGELKGGVSELEKHKHAVQWVSSTIVLKPLPLIAVEMWKCSGSVAHRLSVSVLL